MASSTDLLKNHSLLFPFYSLSCIFFHALSGYLSGLLGAIIFIIVLIPSNQGWMIGSAMIAASITWLASVGNSNRLSVGLARVAWILCLAITVLCLAAISGLIRGLPLAIAGTLVFSGFSLVMTGFCTGLSYFSFTLISTCFGKSSYSKILATSCCIAFLVTTLIGAHMYSMNFQLLGDEKPLMNWMSVETARYLTFLLGSGLGIGILSWTYCLSRDKKHSISFLRSWAVVMSCWTSKSFYNSELDNVDLSHTDLSNIDLRAKSFYRTCFQGAKGLDRARLDNHYFDITNPVVQQLLTQGTSSETDLSSLNLQGAYLRQVDISNCRLIDTNLTLADLNNSILRNTTLTRANLSGADLTDANLQHSILVQTDLTEANLTGADLTGACIENWNINGRTDFTNVQCDYIYRKLDDRGKPSDRYPRDRNFEPEEFVSLYQEVENAVELIFKEGINWRAFAFSLQKLEIDDGGMGLQMRGVEKRGDLWVVKVTHDPKVPSMVVEQKLGETYDAMQRNLAAKEQQVNQLLGIVGSQAETINELSKKPFGNHFNITDSTITNVSGSGQIEYIEAATPIEEQT